MEAPVHCPFGSPGAALPPPGSWPWIAAFVGLNSAWAAGFGPAVAAVDFAAGFASFAASAAVAPTVTAGSGNSGFAAIDFVYSADFAFAAAVVGSDWSHL